MKRIIIRFLADLFANFIGHCPKCGKHCYEYEGWGVIYCIQCGYCFTDDKLSKDGGISPEEPQKEIKEE